MRSLCSTLKVPGHTAGAGGAGGLGGLGDDTGRTEKLARPFVKLRRAALSVHGTGSTPS